MDRRLVFALLVGLAVALAGCATPRSHEGPHANAEFDTGDIAPGDSKTIQYDRIGEVSIHCHPHPFMRHNITVTDEAPAPVHVHIMDGASVDDYAFEPANLTVGRGSPVTYHNHGTLTHTATTL